MSSVSGGSSVSSVSPGSILSNLSAVSLWDGPTSISDVFLWYSIPLIPNKSCILVQYSIVQVMNQIEFGALLCSHDKTKNHYPGRVKQNF